MRHGFLRSVEQIGERLLRLVAADARSAVGPQTGRKSHQRAGLFGRRRREEAGLDGAVDDLEHLDAQPSRLRRRAGSRTSRYPPAVVA